MGRAARRVGFSSYPSWIRRHSAVGRRWPNYLSVLHVLHSRNAEISIRHLQIAALARGKLAELAREQSVLVWSRNGSIEGTLILRDMVGGTTRSSLAREGVVYEWR